MRSLALVCWIGAGTAVMAFTGCMGGHPHEQRTGELLDDKVTAERVREALRSNAAYNFPHVQITSANGTVTLSGSVENEQQKQKAAAIARSIHRVKTVENRIWLE